MYTESASHAVERRDGNGKFIVLAAFSDHFCCEFCWFRRCSGFFGVHSKRTDCSVRTYKRTSVTLNAVFRMPNRYVHCNSALLVCSRSLRHCSVGKVAGKYWNRQTVSLHYRNRFYYVLNKGNKLRTLAGNFKRLFAALRVFPAFRNIYSDECVYTGFNGFVVHFNNRFAFFEIWLFSHILHVFDCLIDRNNICKREESRLKSSICTLAHADFFA